MRRNLPVTQRNYPFPAGETLLSTTDPKGRITYTNQAFVAVSGFSLKELVGKAHNIVRHPDVPPAAFADLWKTMQAGGSWTALIKNRRKNGDHYWVRANSTPVCRDGATVGYMSVRTSPTPQEIERAEKLFAAMNAGKARHLGFRRGIVVRTGWLAWMSVGKTLPVRWRIRAAALLSLLLASGAAWALGAPETLLMQLTAALAVAVVAGAALLEVQIARPLDRIVRQAQTIASGQAGEDFHLDRIDEIGMLLRAVNQAGLNLRALVDEVTQQIEGIQTASREIAKGTDDLSARTEATAASLQQTAASMEQMSSTVSTTADSARQVGEMAKTAARLADEGGRVVDSAVECMSEIDGTSKRIHDIIGVIDGIAFQTNILALNAAVEAARAGEQGRGFAVVASEVRSLAQRSADAAHEIKDLILSSTQTIGAGSSRVQQAGRAIAEVVSMVNRVAALSGEITVATREQAGGVDQVNQAVTQLDHATQQNAALVDENAAAAESLQQQADRLVETVALFKLSSRAERLAPGANADRGSPSAASPRAAGWNGIERRGPDRARNVTRLPSARAAAPVAAARAEPAAGGHTGTDDWESF